MNATQYLRNVGKSMGYIAIDSFKNMAPNTAALFENAKDFSSDLYQTINDFKGKAVGADTGSLKGSIKNTASETWKNARDDFLSGKWYNKERKDAANDQMLKDMGFDFDFNFDIDDFGDYEDTSEKAATEQSQKETQAVVGTINSSVASAANTVASVTAKSTDYLASVQNTNTAALYNLNTQGFNNVNLGLNAINANIGALVSLAKPLTDHMQNSAVFYAKSTEYQDKSLKLLEQLVKNTTPAQRKRSSSGKASFEDYVSDSGIDLARLFGDMKGNASKQLKEYKELFTMLGGGKGLTGDITASPISFLLSSFLIPGLVGEKRRGKIKGFDDYLKTLGIGALARGSRKINDSALGGILSILGIEMPELKSRSSIDTGKYIQGKIDWDGQSKKAITEVIPYYLSKMTAIMSGSGEMEIFDYKTGKFTTTTKLRESYESERRKTASSAGYDLSRKLEKAGTGITKDELDSFSTILMLYGGRDLDKLFSTRNQDRTEYLKNHKEVREFLDNHPGINKMMRQGTFAGNTKGAVSKYDLSNYFGEITGTMARNSRNHAQWEEEGTYGMLFNEAMGLGGNKSGGIGLFARDSAGRSALDYLRGIYRNTARTTIGIAEVAKDGGLIADDSVLDDNKSDTGAKASAKKAESIASGKGMNLAAGGEEGFLEKLKSTLHDIVFNDGGLLGWATNEQTGVKAKFKKLGGKFRDFYFGPQDTVVNQYLGGVVRKTGLAALSEGEIVIPAQFNPYYNKRINRRAQRAGENRAISRFFGGYEEGTINAGSEGSGSKFNVSPDSFLGKAGNTMAKGFSDFGVLLFNLFSESMGLNGEKATFEQQKAKVADIIGNATKSIKGFANEHGSDMLIGAMVGGGVSLLTGAAINPILGAAVGAGTSLIMTSDKVRDFLFGTDSKRGLMGDYGKKLRTFVEDQLPTSLMTGATGGAAGLLLGHPVLGMFIGAGAGFISQSEKAQNLLFGELDKNGERQGGILPAQLQKFLKDAVPGASAGAISGVIATALGGPFGLVGNMLLGAGVGTFVTSEKFKDWFLGKEGEDRKRQGGFVKELRERVLNPVREIFFNLSDRIRQDVRDYIAIPLAQHSKELVTKIYNSRIVQGGIRGVKSIGTGIKTGLGNLGINLDNVKPFDLRGARDKIVARNLMGGYGVRDKSGRFLTAKQKLDRFEGLSDLEGYEDYIGGFGYKTASMLSEDNMDDKQLLALNRQLSKVNNASDLAALGFKGTFTDAQVRRLKESARVEAKARKAKTPIDHIAIVTDNIKNTLETIKTEGLKPYAPPRTSAEYTEYKNAEEAKTAIERKMLELQEQSAEKFNNVFGLGDDGKPLPDKSNGHKESILNKLFGEESIIGKASAFIVKAGKWITAIGLGGLILTAMGIFDNLAYKLLGDHGIGAGVNGGFTYGGTGGGQLPVDENGNIITDPDKIGEDTDVSNKDNVYKGYSAIRNMEYKRTDTYSLSERAGESLVRLGIKNAPKVATALAKLLDETLPYKIIEFTELLKKVPLLKNCGGAVDDMGEQLLQATEKTAKTLNPTKAAAILKEAGKVLTVVMVIFDFTAGYQDAEVTLKVSNPSTGERIISGVLRAVKNLIPFVGALIPDTLVVDIVMATIGKELGLEEFEQQRTDAEAELAQYNEDHGTDLTWSQYVKAEDGLNKHTWTEQVWEGAKTRGGRAIESAQLFSKDAKANGLGSAISNYVGSAWSDAKKSTSEFSGNGLAKGTYFASEVIDNLMPGIIGDIIATNNRVLAYAYDGDFVGIADTNLEVFEGSDDPITGMMSHFINPLLTLQKLIAYPIALIAKVIKDIGETFTGVNSGMDALPKDILTSFGIMSGHALKGDLVEMWKMNVEGNTGIPFLDGLQAVFMNINRVMNTPWAATVFAIRKVVEGVVAAGKGVVDATLWTADLHIQMNPYVMGGDIEGLWNTKFVTPSDNKLVDGLQNVAEFVSKITFTPATALSWVFHKVTDTFDKTITGIKTGFNWLNIQANIGKNLIQNEDSGDAALEELLNVPDPGEDVTFPGLFKTAAITTRILGIGLEVAKGAFRAIKDMIAESDFGKTIEAIKTDIPEAASKALGGDALGLVYMHTSNQAKGGFWKGISDGTLSIAKTILGPISVITTGVSLLVNGIKDNIAPAKATFSAIGDDAEAMWNLAKKGEVIDLLGYESTANQDGEHPFWGTLGIVIDGIVRVPMTLVGVATWAGSKVAESVKTTIDSIPILINATKDQIIYGAKVFEDGWNTGDLSSLFTSNLDWSTSDPLEKTYNIVTGVFRLMGAPMGLLKYAGEKTGEAVKKTVDGVKTIIEAAKTQVAKGTEIFSDGWNTDTISTFLSDGINLATTNPMEVMFNGLTIMTRAIGMPMGLLKYAGKKIGDTITEKVEAIKTDAESYKTGMDAIKKVMGDSSKKFTDVQDVETPAFAGPLSGIMNIGFTLSKVVATAFKCVTGFVDDIKSQFSFQSLWDNLKSIANYKAGGNSGIAGGGSGFISQRDSRYAGMGLGGYNVGEMGCGPAAASMVLGNSMSSNVSLARKYQTAGGTDLAYFGEAFARNGRTPIYYNLGGGASGVDMVRDIASGKPVVLMGRDPYNTSKANSPFGPNNHYVVARGFRNGGIVVDDPEASAGGMIYDPSILANVTAAVGAGRSGLGGRRRRLLGVGGGAATVNSVTDQIWSFFKAKGYSDAAVAGILANIQHESGFSTTSVGDGGTSYGLCQWHASRKTKLANFAKSMGRDISDLTAQLSYLDHEISAGAAGSGYTSIKDPYTAGYNFCVNFEVPVDAGTKGKQRGNLAKEFYAHYKGQTGSYSDSELWDNLKNIAGGETGSPLSEALKNANNKTLLQRILGFTSSLGSFGSAFSKFNIGNILSNAISGNKQSSFTFKSAGLFNGNGTIGDSSYTANWIPEQGQPVDYMRAALGKLTYSRDNRDPEKGGGDCASTVAWALTKAGLPVTTDARWQYVNENGTTPSWQKVLWYNGGRRLNGAIPSNVKLQPNDVIFYSWADSKSTHPDKVDHVEMYNGGNQVIGNGGGIGTRIRPLSTDQDSIIKIVRPKGVGASGSGLADLAMQPKRMSTITKGGRVYNLADYKRIPASAGASNIGGGIDKSTALILKTMITLIESIVKNTDDISAIYQLLSTYCANNSDTKSAEIISRLMQERDTDNSRIEDNLADLKATVDSILAS